MKFSCLKKNAIYRSVVSLVLCLLVSSSNCMVSVGGGAAYPCVAAVLISSLTSYLWYKYLNLCLPTGKFLLCTTKNREKITETLKGVSPTPSFPRLSCQHIPFSCFFAKKIEASLMKRECVNLNSCCYLFMFHCKNLPSFSS